MIFCLLLGSLLTHAENPAAMIEKLKGPAAHPGNPWEAQKTKLEPCLPMQTAYSPFILTEFLIDTSKYYQLPSCYERYPGVAFDGTNFMGIWMDYAHAQIVGTRITLDGTILDIPPFTISSTVSDDQPDIVFDGTNYFAVWTMAPNIYGARIAPDGTVLDPGGILISNTGSYCPAVTYGNGVYLVVWESTVSQYDALAALVDTGGTVLLNFSLSADPGVSEAWPNVSFNGANFLAVWYVTSTSSGGIKGSRIEPDGTNLDPGGFWITNINGDMWPVVDFDGTNWLVVWSQSIGGGFQGAWVTPAGTPFGTFSIPGSYGMTFPELVLGDSLHWVEAIDITDPNIYATRIDFQGNTLNNPWIAVDTAAGWQAYGGDAYGDSTFIAIWEDQVEYNIYARRYAPNGTPRDSVRFIVNIFDSVTNSQYAPGVAFDGSKYMVIYSDNRNTADNNVFGSMVTMSGALLDPEGFPINQGAGAQNQPRIAFGDSLYLGVWETGTDIWGARILPDGTVLDPGGIHITSGGYEDYRPAVSYSNGIFLVVYNRIYGSPACYKVFGTRVTPDGQILDPSGIIIQNKDNNHYSPEVAGYDGGFLATWYLFTSQSKIEGTRVNFQGVVIDSPAIQISPPNLGVDYAGLHSVAAGSDTLLVVWHRNQQEIVGARLDSSGNVLDPAGISICVGQPNNRTHPSAAFNGRDFLVVWQDSRQDNSQYDIYGARVSPAGIVLDTNGIELINSTYSRGNIELASATPESDTGAPMLLVFDGFVDGPHNTNRALGAIYYPPTGVEEGYAQKISTDYRVDISPNMSCQKPYVLSYSFPLQTKISVNAYDITGRLVKNVCNSNLKGVGEIKFTLEGMPQGIYFVKVNTEDKTETTKVVWLR